MALIGGDPQAMQGMRESIADFYKRQVSPDGRVNLRAHEQFMRQYALPLRQFFSQDEMRILQEPGQIERALQSRERAREVALDRINKSFEADIADLSNPRRLLSFVLDPNNASNISRMVEFLEKTPDVLRGVRSEFRKEMAERVAGAVEGGTRRRFSPANLNRFLHGKGGEKGMAANIRALFGLFWGVF